MTRVKLYCIFAGVLLVALLGWQLWRNHMLVLLSNADVARSVVIDQSHKAQTIASARVDTVVDTLRIREDHYIKVASVLKATSDTILQSSKTLADTAIMYKLRWQLVGIALDSTTAALSDARQRVAILTVDRDAWKAVADSATASQDRLRADLKVAQSGCRIIPFVDCPSRTVVAAVAFVVGAGTTALVARNNFHR